MSGTSAEPQTFATGPPVSYAQTSGGPPTLYSNVIRGGIECLIGGCPTAPDPDKLQVGVLFIYCSLQMFTTS